MPPFKNVANQIFGHLTALNPIERRDGGARIWSCRCDYDNCGNLVEVSIRNLQSGNTSTCGEHLHKGENNPVSKLTADNVRTIRQLLRNGNTPKEIAPLYSVSVSAIAAIKSGSNWSWLQ
jgi:hypothetical protein